MARTPDPDTEKLKRQVVFVLQPSLFAEFEERCKEQYKTVSEVLRDMIRKFVQENM
jgi:metal-responsive CopG/Arc/MetJ family transcriptional regulator